MQAAQGNQVHPGATWPNAAGLTRVQRTSLDHMQAAQGHQVHPEATWPQCSGLDPSATLEPECCAPMARRRKHARTGGPAIDRSPPHEMAGAASGQRHRRSVLVRCDSWVRPGRLWDAIEPSVNRTYQTVRFTKTSFGASNVRSRALMSPFFGCPQGTFLLRKRGKSESGGKPFGLLSGQPWRDDALPRLFSVRGATGAPRLSRAQSSPSSPAIALYVRTLCAGLDFH